MNDSTTRDPGKADPSEAAIPVTMRAALLTGIGGPAVLELRHDAAVPTPGPGEALIKVAACGVNNTDINTRVGWYSRSVSAATSGSGFGEARSDDSTWGGAGMSLPRIQGADICGRVVATGCSVDEALIGRRVLVDPWIRDPDDPNNQDRAGFLGSELDGGFAEYCAVPARNVHPINSTFSDAELASFACSWSTAENMLQQVGLEAGQSVAVPGSSGGVGSALVQLAKRRGARVVAVTGASKLERVLDLGADSVVIRNDGTRTGAGAATDGSAGASHGAVPARALAANAEPFHVVADVVGGADFGGWLDVLARGGRYVTSGAIAGPLVELDLRTLYLKDLQLHGATVIDPGIFANLVGYIERGEVLPMVAGTYPLEQIHEAQDAFGRKQHVGALVITL